MIEIARSFCADDSGATVIEYGLIAAIIGIGIIASLEGIAPELVGTFSNAETGLATANN